MLRPLCHGADSLAAVRSLLGDMHRVLLCDPSRARDFIRVIDYCWIDHGYTVPDDLAFIRGIDDDWALAEEGVGRTTKEEFTSLMENLSRFDLSEENQIRRSN